MNLEDAKQIVCKKDGYTSFEQVPVELELEYIERAYRLIISKMYSEEEIRSLLIEAFLIGVKDLGTEYLYKWFREVKK